MESPDFVARDGFAATKHCGGQALRAGCAGLRLAAIVCLGAASLVGSPALAGDDGSAPLWQGLGSIVAPVLGFGGKKAPPIDYRPHGKLVVPPNDDLPPPGTSATADPAWPVNQEIVRRKAREQEGKKTIAGVGDARLRYTHPFPAGEPVTVRAVDPDTGQTVKCEGSCGSGSSVLGNLNPMHWFGLGKPTAASLGPEPDREWLTDPPKGFRAPVGPVQGSASK